MNLFFVYIIYSSRIDKFYIGYTTNLEKRLIEHNTGNSTYTSKSADWKLKWIKEFVSREDAMKEEKRIKTKKSRKYIEWLVSSAD